MYKNTIAMNLALHGIIPPDYCLHEPNLKNIFGETVAMILATHGIIIDDWYHDPSMKNMFGETVAMILRRNKHPIPDEWEFPIDYEYLKSIPKFAAKLLLGKETSLEYYEPGLDNKIDVMVAKFMLKSEKHKVEYKARRNNLSKLDYIYQTIMVYIYYIPIAESSVIDYINNIYDQDITRVYIRRSMFPYCDLKELIIYRRRIINV